MCAEEDLRTHVQGHLIPFDKVSDEIRDVILRSDAGVDARHLPPELHHMAADLALAPVPDNLIPVPFFGNIENAEVAALSLNPSNVEFWDRTGSALLEPERRFKLDDRNSEKQIYEACLKYFDGNPYQAWFRNFDYISGLVGWDCGESSQKKGSFVNIDLIHWVTRRKFSDLQDKEIELLLPKTEYISKLFEYAPFTRLILSSVNNKHLRAPIAQLFPGLVIPTDFTIQPFVIREAEIGQRRVEIFITNKAVSYFNTLKA